MSTIENRTDPTDPTDRSEELPAVDLSGIASLGLDLDQYFGLWAVESDRFQQMLDRIGSMNLAAHVEIHQAAKPAASPSAASPAGDDTGIKVINIAGTLTKRGSSLSSAQSLVRLRQAVRSAARDPQIAGILLVIDSPGGTVAGTADLAKEVAKAAESKPVYAYAEDLMASAAYWVGSQADKVFANDATALIGSIGTFIGMYDYSAKAEKKGIKPVLIKTGKYKGAGFSGTEITDEQKAYWQAIVDQTQAEFSAGIARGRKLDAARVAELADGRVHVASAAVSMGLIDGIQSYETTIAALGDEIRKRRSDSQSARTSTSSKESPKMSEATVVAAVAAATFMELKNGLVGATADFICAQLEKGATLAQAQAAWMAEQNRLLSLAQKEAAEAKEALTKAAAKKPGVELLGDGKGVNGGQTEGGDPVAEWNAALEAMVARHKGKRQKAVSALVKAQPALHDAFLAAANSGKKD